MDSELKKEVERLYAKYIEVLTRVEALEEELHGPKRRVINEGDLLHMMPDVYSMIPDFYRKLSECGIEDDIGELIITGRTRNCLNAAGIKKISDLLLKEESELLRLKNFGRTSLNDLNRCLATFGWKLRAGSVRVKPPEEYKTLYYKHLVPEIKRLERAGFSPDQIEKELRKSNPRNSPCVPTIKSILASKVYQ